MASERLVFVVVFFSKDLFEWRPGEGCLHLSRGLGQRLRSSRPGATVLLSNRPTDADDAIGHSYH